MKIGKKSKWAVFGILAMIFFVVLCILLNPEYSPITHSGFTAVKPIDWTITSAPGGDSITLLNGEGVRIDINNIILTRVKEFPVYAGQSRFTARCSDLSQWWFPVIRLLKSLGILSFTEKCDFTCTGISNPVNLWIESGDTANIQLPNGCSGTAGNPYKILATIAYNKTIGTVAQYHTSVGPIQGSLE